MARRDRERDDAAERLSEDHRPLELERVAELDDVRHPAVEVPLRRIVAVAPPLAAMVEQDELRDVGQRRERVRQPGVVEARGRRGGAAASAARASSGPSGTSFVPITSKKIRVPSRERDPHSLRAASFSFCRLVRTSR